MQSKTMVSNARLLIVIDWEYKKQYIDTTIQTFGVGKICSYFWVTKAAVIIYLQLKINVFYVNIC